MIAPNPLRLEDVPLLETERLRLRALREADFEDEYAFYASDRSHFVGGPKGPEEVWRVMATMIGHWVLRGYGFFALEEKATGRYMGRAGLWYPLGWPEPEIGWHLMGHATGRGLATEAARRVRDWAYRDLGWETAISMIAAGNTRSAALARRIGATLERSFDHHTHGAVEIWRHPSPRELS